MQTAVPSLKQLELKHRYLDERIAKEEEHPYRDQFEIQRLKRLKLALRQNIERRRLAEAGPVTPEPAA